MHSILPHLPAHGCRWSGLDRSERYRKRCGDQGDARAVDTDNPLPNYLDPITFQPVVNPAISPYGHVMGLATWKVGTLMWRSMRGCAFCACGVAAARVCVCCPMGSRRS